MDKNEGAEHVHTNPCCPRRPTQRRAHTKSRAGCQNCKTRRVKCDEKKPVCGNCTRSSISCDFSDAGTTPGTSAGPGAATTAPRKRGRPLNLKHMPEVAQTSGILGRALPALNAEDLQVFYHYVTVTSLTFGDDGLWRDKVPRLAFEHHFVLHLLLAVSALHMARLRLGRKDQYRQLAESHCSSGLRAVTALLPCISRDNCSALYIATVLVCNYTFANTPINGHLLVVSDGAEVAWWSLFRGVRFVIETMGLEAVFSGCLGPAPPESLTKMRQPEGVRGYIPWEEPLATLEVLINDGAQLGTANLANIHAGLVDCYREVFGTADNPEKNSEGKMHVVMRWLWFIEDDFIAQVKASSPGALVLLAYFSVLLQTTESFWFMEGWAHHVLLEVVEQLDSEYIPWIRWPRQQIV